MIVVRAACANLLLGLAGQIAPAGDRHRMSRKSTKLLKAALTTLHYTGVDGMVAPVARGVGLLRAQSGHRINYCI